MLARVWSLVRAPLVKDWTQQHVAAWDAAAEGNSCLQEVYLRANDEELAHAMKINFGHALADIQ